ncbi:MAG: hypothetical protein JWR54_968 [Mucilaginibacter sp.]|nr:hypothetical protein [Mucilaginibacter sp.]
MDELSKQVAERKTADPGSRIKLFFRLSTKKGGPAKRKKKQKKKNALKYGKLSEFPTFQHGKQTTNYLSFIFTIITCIVHLRINAIRCIVLAGLTHPRV